MNDQLLTIGEVADSAGLSVSTVRYYDAIGVIDTTIRVGGQRRFHRDTIGRLQLIRRAKAAGFSLEEIGQILDVEDGGWHAVVDTKLAELRDRRDELDTMISTLDEIRSCGCPAPVSCGRGDVR